MNQRDNLDVVIHRQARCNLQSVNRNLQSAICNKIPRRGFRTGHRPGSARQRHHWRADRAAAGGRARVSRLPRAVARRLHVEHRHVDAEGRAELAGPRPDRLGQLSRARCVSGRAAHPAVHADWRRGRRPARSPRAAAGLAGRADVVGLRAGDSRGRRLGADLARARAVVSLRVRAGVWRAGVSVADPVAGPQGPPAQRRRAQLDPVQHRAGDRPAAGRRDAALAGQRVVLHGQRPVVPRRDRGAAVAAHAARRADRPAAHARRAADRARVRARRAGDSHAHGARAGVDVSRRAAADVPAGVCAQRLSRRRRAVQPDDGVVGRRRGGRRDGGGLDGAIQPHGRHGAVRAGAVWRADGRFCLLAARSGSATRCWS